MYPRVISCLDPRGSVQFSTRFPLERWGDLATLFTRSVEKGSAYVDTRISLRITHLGNETATHCARATTLTAVARGEAPHSLFGEKKQPAESPRPIYNSFGDLVLRA